MADVGKGLFFWHTRKRYVAAPPNFILSTENNNAYIHNRPYVYKIKVIQDHQLASSYTISNCTGERNNNYYKVTSRYDGRVRVCPAVIYYSIPLRAIPTAAGL